MGALGGVGFPLAFVDQRAGEMYLHHRLTLPSITSCVHICTSVLRLLKLEIKSLLSTLVFGQVQYLLKVLCLGAIVGQVMT